MVKQEVYQHLQHLIAAVQCPVRAEILPEEKHLVDLRKLLCLSLAVIDLIFQTFFCQFQLIRPFFPTQQVSRTVKHRSQ